MVNNGYISGTTYYYLPEPTYPEYLISKATENGKSDIYGVIIQNISNGETKYQDRILDGVETEELNLVPSTVEQVMEGMFDKVTIPGDAELLPENIKTGVEVFGVVGSLEAVTPWVGTEAEYNAITTKDPNTLYCIPE